MKKLLFLLSLVIILANSAFAQTKKKAASAPKATVQEPAPKAATGSIPKLETKEPSFAGFTGSFVKYGKVSGSNRSFNMSVEYRPWFFEVSGIANADYNTQDLDEDVIVVLAYYDARGKTADGVNYQAGLFDLMIYFDDEPIKISNLNFKLIGEAAAGSEIIAQAKTWNFEQGRVFKTKKYDNAIIKAQAAALDKSDIAKEQAAAKKRAADSIAKEEKRVADSIAREEKRKKDSIAREGKRRRDSIEMERVADSIAEFEALKEQAKRRAAARKKVVEEDYDDEDYDPPPKKKTTKKKRN